MIDCIVFKESMHLHLHKDNIDFTISRKHSRNSLKKTAKFFEQEKNFTADNILFLHEWQKNPRYCHKKYEHLMNKNLEEDNCNIESCNCIVFETKCLQTILHFNKISNQILKCEKNIKKN